MITIVTWGGHGDVRPYVALALGLKNAGYLVRFITTPSHEEFISSYEFPVQTIYCENFKFVKKKLENSPFHIIDNQKTVLNPFKGSYLNKLWDACQDAEAIIFNTYGFAAYYIAEKLDIPCYAACTQPHHPTYAFPSPYMPIIKPLVGLYNRLSYDFFDQLLWQAVRQPINQWRQETLNLPALPFWSGITKRMHQKQLPFLYSYSPSLLPKPSDWPELVDVTGYWFLDRPADWQPPANLVEFLAAGTPPVYIEIRHQEVTKKMILDVLKQTGQRAIVRGMGFKEDDTKNLADRAFIVESIPHDWLFPQMAAIVHHGGAGTTMSSLRAGVPIVIVPLEGDHFLYAYKVAKLGIGTQPILQKQISAASIAKAIKIAVNSKDMKVKAASIGEKLQAENGVDYAIRILHKYFQSHTKESRRNNLPDKLTR